ncbi:MAG: ABC transporter permease [Actinomycetota bacterium]
MRGRDAIRLVARREWRERGRDKSLIVSTLVTLTVISAVIVLNAFSSGTETYEIGYVGGDLKAVAESAKRLAPTFDAKATVTSFDDEGEAGRALRAGEVEVVVTEAGRLLVEQEADPQLEALLSTAYREFSVSEELRAAGLSDRQIARALNPEPLELRALDPPDPNRDSNSAVAFIGVMLLYGQIFGYGFWVATGVIEEKSSRVVEILLSAIRPRELLAGKVIGIGVLGFLQLIFIALFSLGLALVMGVIDFPAGAFSTTLLVMFWFVLGYAFYSCLFAAAGALVSSSEELQTAITPLSMVILASLFGAIAASQNPEGLIARIVSLLPPSAPLSMPVRMALGGAAPWEIALSILLVVAGTVGLVRVGARLYEGAVLHTGGQVKIRDAWAWARS